MNMPQDPRELFPSDLDLICAPQDFRRAFAALAHAGRGDILAVNEVIVDADETKRVGEMLVAGLFAMAGILREVTGENYEKMMLAMTACAASYGDIKLPDDEG